MKVAAAQFHPRFASPEENRTILQKYCKRAAQREVELLVFPEMCVTGYNFPSRKALSALAEPVPEGPTTQLWIDAAKIHKMIIVGGLAELGENGELYNSAAVVGPSGFLGCYRKLHLFNREKRLFSPGNQPPRVYRLSDVTLGVLVCFDWAFPEVARILMLEGCEVLCHPANLVLPFAQRVMIARSIENRFFTITANRLGTEKDLTFHGRSQITDCRGELLAKGSATRPQLLIADINPAEARDKYLTPNNHIIHDRRVDFYERLLQK
ncbi:MAG: nitrilase-related carbon-nitrogen hydrolase [Promethearchaeota archaeon]